MQIVALQPKLDMTMTRSNMALLLVIGLVTFIGCAQGPNGTPNPSPFSDFRVDEIRTHISALEQELQTSQVPRSVEMQLALMYALSSRLDVELSMEERNEHATLSIRIIEDLRKRLSQAHPDDVESDLYLVFLLAQAYATIGQVDHAWSVLSEMEKQFVSDPPRIDRVQQAKRLLKEALDNGYPHSALRQGVGVIPSR